MLRGKWDSETQELESCGKVGASGGSVLSWLHCQIIGSKSVFYLPGSGGLGCLAQTAAQHNPSGSRSPHASVEPGYRSKKTASLVK